MPFDTRLGKVARDIMRAVAKRRALPPGYALAIVIVKVPKEGEEGKMHVATAPPQEPHVAQFILREAADGITGEVRVSEVTRPGPIVPTGHA
jgi:hypothetical protein